jgi:hypothetical protein
MGYLDGDPRDYLDYYDQPTTPCAALKKRIQDLEDRVAELENLLHGRQKL